VSSKGVQGMEEATDLPRSASVEPASIEAVRDKNRAQAQPSELLVTRKSREVTGQQGDSSKKLLDQKKHLYKLKAVLREKR